MPPSIKPLSACVINYNGEAYLGDTLAALAASRQFFKEILLVDNASTDGSLELVAERLPAVHLLRLNENRGPGAARNLGFRAAASNRVLMLDNDVVLGAGCVEALQQALDANPAAALAMPSVRYAHSKETIQYEGAGCHFLGLMHLHRQNTSADARTSSRRVNSLVTACFLADRRKLPGPAPFDESFFFNLEDHDMGVRTRIYGHEIICVPSAVCYHREGSKGLSYRPGRPYPHRRLGYLIRNRWQVVLKNYRHRTLLLLFPMLWVYEGFQVAGLCKKRQLKVWLQSLAWFMRRLPQILQLRRLIQRARQTPDRDILHAGPLPITSAFADRPLERAAMQWLNRIVLGYWRLVKRYI